MNTSEYIQAMNQLVSN